MKKMPEIRNAAFVASLTTFFIATAGLIERGIYYIGVYFAGGFSQSYFQKFYQNYSQSKSVWIMFLATFLATIGGGILMCFGLLGLSILTYLWREKETS